MFPLFYLPLLLIFAAINTCTAQPRQECYPCLCYPQNAAPTLLVCQDNYIAEFPLLPIYVTQNIREILIYNTLISCLPPLGADYINLQSLGESLNPYFVCSCLDVWRVSLPHVTFDSHCYHSTDEFTTTAPLTDISSQPTTATTTSVEFTSLEYNQNLSTIATVPGVNSTIHSPGTDDCRSTLWVIISSCCLALICIFIICMLAHIWYRRYRRGRQSGSAATMAYRLNTIYMSPVHESVEDSEI